MELKNQFGQEFRTSADRAIGQLIQYKNSVLEWLRTERDQFSAIAEAAIKEAQSCLAEGSPPTNLLTEALVTLPSDPS